MLFIYKEYLLQTHITEKAICLDVWRRNRYLGFTWGFNTHEAAIAWIKPILDRGDDRPNELVPF